MEKDKVWRRCCPHCKKSLVIDIGCGVVRRPGRRSVGGAGREATVEIANPVEASDTLWAWRERLDMTTKKAAQQVGIDKSTRVMIEQAKRKRITKTVHKKIEEATGICL